MSEHLTQTAPMLMGILNVTPDSFSDGGRYTDAQAAAEHGLQMACEGASIIDVGGESTRPGSERVPAAEQTRRVVEPIRALREVLDANGFRSVRISIDTTLAEVAQAALDAGASILNDVSACREDERVFALAAERGVPIVLMHMLGQPGNMQEDPRYEDVVDEVLGFLSERADAAVAKGVSPENIWIDPGIGFGKTLDHNLALLGALDRFVATRFPVLLGVSRKRFIAGCCEGLGMAEDASDRLPGTLAAGLIGALAGVTALRVHDVAAHRQALAVLGAAQLNTSRTNGP